MLDLELLSFYNNVKDPSWPDIKSYYDFCCLPTNIKKECNDIYGLQERKNQIENADYWINQTQYVCVYKNLAFVPVPKCALAYYTTLFMNLGWERRLLSDVDPYTTKFFGNLMHPTHRWLKGITQWLVRSYAVGDDVPLENNQWLTQQRPINYDQLTADLQRKEFQAMLSTMNTGDIHSTSYYAMFGNLLEKINWIPMDVMSDNEIKIKMMNFFRLHGHDISLPLNTARIHQSTSQQLEIFNIVKELCLTTPEQLYSFYTIYSKDLKFYNHLVEIQSM
jgi:hypothetical protein